MAALVAASEGRLGRVFAMGRAHFPQFPVLKPKTIVFVLYVRFGQVVESHELVRRCYYLSLGWLSKTYVGESAWSSSPSRFLARVAFASSVFN